MLRSVPEKCRKRSENLRKIVWEAGTTFNVKRDPTAIT